MKKITFTALALTITCSLGFAQHNITTIAGNGTAGATGDGSAATAAEINHPYGVAVDAAGNIYIADQSNNKIRMVNTSGTISTFAGNGTAGFSGDGSAATAAELSSPAAVAVDPLGNVYIADKSNNRIRIVSTAGVIGTAVGIGIGFAGDGGPATAAELRGPTAIAFDASPALYIADTYNYRIRKVDASLTITTFAGTGIAGYSGDGGAAVSADLDYPYGVAADNNGNIYIADQTNNRIRIVNSSGTINTIAGTGTAGYSGDGGVASAAEINAPAQLCMGPGGSLFIADATNNVIRKINLKYGNIITTVAGNGTGGYSGDGGNATAAELSFPWGVAVNSSGDLYIADYTNNRVRRVPKLDVLAVNNVSVANAINIYPNPATDNINIELGSSKSNTVVSLYNIEGQEVYNSVLKNTDLVKIPVNGFKQGIYLVRIATEDGTILTRKVEIAK